MSAPLVTVLMPVYNGERDLQKAVDSILGQTFRDFEFLIINDGSRDGSGDLLNSLSDARIRVVHQENHGLAATLNIGLALSRGRYIARQDQDDLSRPERLASQVAYLEANPECALLGTAAEIWVGDEPTERAHDHPTSHAELAFLLLFNNPFVHSSVMFRKDAVQSIGGYSTDPARQPPEDFELWSRMARHFRVANLPDRLLVYREVPQSMSRTGPNPFLDRLVTICAENLVAVAGGGKDSECHAMNVAALTHSADHRLMSPMSLKRMTDLVRRAGAPFARELPAVEALIEERAHILRYQWTIRQANAGWAMPFLRRIRDIGRRVGVLRRNG